MPPQNLKYINGLYEFETSDAVHSVIINTTNDISNILAIHFNLLILFVFSNIFFNSGVAHMTEINNITA